LTLDLVGKNIIRFPQLHLGGDWNRLMLKLAKNSGLLGPPSPRNQRVKTKKIHFTYVSLEIGSSSSNNSLNVLPLTISVYLFLDLFDLYIVFKVCGFNHFSHVFFIEIPLENN
jgi:hypothetical protein